MREVTACLGLGSMGAAATLSRIESLWRSYVSRVLAYCGLLHDPGISLPEIGVNGAPVKVLTEGKLNLLWSEVDWPFDPASMQRNAVEFHGVVNHVFDQTAVAPFRLLTVFEDEWSLTAFAAQHHEGFVADLERLKSFVQMECVVYFVRPQRKVDASPGKVSAQQNAELWHMVKEHVQKTNDALSDISRDVRVREIKSGNRIFVLVKRGKADAFRAAVQNVAVPQAIARRISGPRPASEFLSESIFA
jgi:hypothetical protein